MRSTPEARGKIRKSHPEVCFRALSGTPVADSKKVSKGILERLDVLRRHLEGVEPPVLEALIRNRKQGAALDDILDAAVLAATARFAASRARTLPVYPETDAQGFPTEIVHAVPDDRSPGAG